MKLGIQRPTELSQKTGAKPSQIDRRSERTTDDGAEPEQGSMVRQSRVPWSVRAWNSCVRFHGVPERASCFGLLHTHAYSSS
jgi:hypothetical protein